MKTLLPRPIPLARAIKKIARVARTTDQVLRTLSATGPALRAMSDSAAFFDAATRAASPGKAAKAGKPDASARFVSGEVGQDGRGRYKLYIPSNPTPAHAPLVVLLHGCTQDPDDFAAGTDMNRRAERDGFYVLYPEQSTAANPSRCWNWFSGADQRRGQGEPARIAAMTLQVIARHDLDPTRVHVAGLSAGGAMAAIVASEYPELFASVGVHSGLPSGAASNLPDALAVMRTGRSRRAKSDDGASRFVPTIVFHGDRDATVHPSNGVRTIEDALALRAAFSPGSAPASESVVEGVAPGGQRFTRTTYALPDGRSLAEHWLVHDAAHAWSGGAPAGSHTDARGPSATDEMLRFFRAHPLAADAIG